jgi:antitoxin VapB
MGLNIRNESVAQLARELAATSKTTVTGAIKEALEEALDRERRNLSLAERLEALAQRKKAEAGPNARELTKDEIDEMWGR